MTYSPPAELVERVRDALIMNIGAGDDECARACIAASGLGEIVGVLREIVDEGGGVRIGRLDDIRALLARLDTQTSEGGGRK